MKGGRKVIAKLEQRAHELEAELDGEQRRYQEVNKNVSKAERHVRELQFQVDEDKKNFERMQDLVGKLQDKIKMQKKQLEEAVSFAHHFSHVDGVIFCAYAKLYYGSICYGMLKHLDGNPT